MQSMPLSQHLSGDILRRLRDHGHVIHLVTRRDVAQRYRGSVLGIGWMVVSPLLMLAIFTFVFSVIFQVRWGQELESTLAFGIVLYCGLIVHQFVAECLTRAPGLLLAFPSYIKNVVFPVETLGFVIAGSAAVGFLLNFGVLVAAHILLLGWPPATIFLAPLVVLPMMIFSMFVIWSLAALGIYVRDLSQITQFLTIILMFMSPIFYPLDAVPDQFRWVLELNPMAFTIEQLRAVVIFGEIPNLGWTLFAVFIACVAARLGLAFFMRLRVGFADVL